MENLIEFNDYNRILSIIDSLSAIETEKLYEEFRVEGDENVRLENKDILSKIRYFNSNLSDFKKFWDDKLGGSSNAHKDVDYKYPKDRKVRDDVSPYQTFDGIRKKSNRELEEKKIINSIIKNKNIDKEETQSSFM